MSACSPSPKTFCVQEGTSAKRPKIEQKSKTKEAQAAINAQQKVRRQKQSEAKALAEVEAAAKARQADLEWEKTDPGAKLANDAHKLLVELEKVAGRGLSLAATSPLHELVPELKKFDRVYVGSVYFDGFDTPENLQEACLTLTGMHHTWHFILQTL